MKLSLYQLEAARTNPRRYGAQLAAAELANEKAKFNSHQFRTYLRNAVRDYHEHKSWPGILAEFSKACLKNLSRIQYHIDRTAAYEKTLKGYFISFPNQGVTFIQMEKKFSLTVGSHVVTGKVDRFDLKSPSGYRATELRTDITKTWRKKLRWPLIQQALAHEMNASPAEMEVGIHNFEDGVSYYHTFEHAELEAALAQAENICDEIAIGREEYGVDELAP